MARWAAIDVGTNSTRLLIADVEGEWITPLETGLITTRLGEGMVSTQTLSVEARERTLAAIQEFVRRCRKKGVERIRVGATSAVREAGNGDDFRCQVRAATGLDLEVFSGSMEARLSFLGVTAALPLAAEGPTLVVDIGGGSTELILGEGKDVKVAMSVPLGAVRLTEAFFSVKAGPVPTSEMQHLEKHILKTLDKAGEPFIPPAEPLVGVGVGGTVTTLAAIYLELDRYFPNLVHGTVLPHDFLLEIQGKLAGMDCEERKKVTGLQPERADIIVAGIVILTTLMTKFGLPEIIASEGDILLGMLADLREKEGISP